MSIDPSTIARLRWRCRRGMRELDSAMRAYLDHHYVDASAEEQALFEELQELQDPRIYELVSGKAREARYQTIIDKMSNTLAGKA